DYGKKLETSALHIEKSNRRIGKLDALLNAGREPILIAVVVAVIFIQTTYFNSSLGPILISLIFFYRALGYLMQLQIRWNKFLADSGSLENMALFGKELRENSEATGTIELLDSITELDLKKVSFSYHQTQILE